MKKIKTVIFAVALFTINSCSTNEDLAQQATEKKNKNVL